MKRIAVSLAAAAALSCHGAAAPASVSADDFLGQLAGALCPKVVACFGADPYVAQHCEDIYGRGIARWKPGVAAGRLTYDAAAGAACLDAIASGGCDALAHSIEFALPPACVGVVTGTVPSGGGCYADAECAAGVCTFTGSECPGKCAGAGVKGGSCAVSTDCAASLGCDGSTCAVLAKAGGSCADYAACASGFFCNLPPLGAGAGVCEKQRNAGDACGEDFEHAKGAFLGECGPGRVCAGVIIDAAQFMLTPGKCAAPAMVGSACTLEMHGKIVSTGCAIGLTCDTGTCALAPESGPCSGDIYAACRFGLAACDQTSKTCGPLVDVGAACGSQKDCKSDVCASGKCAAAPGGACTPG